MTERDIFIAAIQKESATERAAYLHEACGTNIALRERVEGLLKVHDNAGGFLESPAPAPSVNLNGKPLTEGPGVVIGPYKLLEQIGEGGMGVVYMAEQQKSIRRKVALKIIKPGMDTKQVIARFEAERQALALMDHPNIARVLDAGATESGRPYFVMELVRGIPITDYCDREKLSIGGRLELFVLVCQAVQHAHQKGIIHRDLKPTNVLITLHDGVPVPKIIDFGVAKAMGQQLTEKTLFTAFAQLVGTPLYMSPEQAELSGLDVDTRTDIYSLGVLLYELLTGTTPFDQDTFRAAAYDEIRRIIREQEPPRPSTRLSTLGVALPTVSSNRASDPRKLGHSIRGELDWIAMRALEKDRRRRYEAASAFAADVQRFLADEPVQACPPSAWYRFGKFARRNRAALSMVTLSTSALVVFLVVNSLLVGQERRRTAEQRDLAVRHSYLAVEQRKLAEERRQEAVERAAALERQLVIDRVNRAHGEWEANNTAEAERLLDACPPALRSWEWNYVKRLCHLDLFTYRGHGDIAVSGVAFSPDGKLVASGAGGGVGVKPGYGEVVVWEAATGREVFARRGLKRGIQCVAYSPDGRLVAAGSTNRGKDPDSELWVWEVATGREILNRVRPGPDLMSLQFSPDGKWLAAGHLLVGDGSKVPCLCRLWNVATGEEVAAFPARSSIGGVAFSPDGKRLALAGKDMVELWDVQARKAVRVLRPRFSPQFARSLAYSPDGQRIAVAYSDNTIQVWGPETHQPDVIIQGKASAYGLAFSPDSCRLAAANDNRSVTLWDAATGAELSTFRGHTVWALAVAFSPDGQRLVSSAADGTVKVWDATTSNPLVLREAALRLALSADGQRLAAVDGRDTLRLWNATTGELILTLNAQTQSLAFRRDGQRLVLAGPDALVKVLETTTGRVILTLRGHIGHVMTAVYGPDGQWILSGGVDGTVRRWNAEAGGPPFTFHEDADALPITQVVSSDDGRRAFSAAVDGTWTMWDTATGRVLDRRRWAEGELGPLALSPDGRSIVRYSIGSAMTMPEGLTIRDVDHGREIRTLRAHHGPIRDVEFSPDGRRIASGGRDYSIRLWDRATGEEVFALHGLGGSLSNVTFSQDGHRIAAGTVEGLVYVWDGTPVRSGSTATSRQGGDSVVQGTGASTPPDAASRIAYWRAMADADRAFALVERPDSTPQDAGRAVELARRAVEREPKNVGCQWVLGVARYRTGDWPGAIEALTKSEELAPDQYVSSNGFFLAMAHWQLGHRDEARAWYDKAVAWMVKNAPEDEVIYRDEAAAVLGRTELPANVFARP